MRDLPTHRRGRSFLLVQGMTLGRIPLALAFAVLLLYADRTIVVLSVCALLLALIELSDLFDGLLARRLGLVTEWGAMLDPYADSISRLLVYWGLACAGLTLAVVPLAMACRDVTVAYCRIVWTRHGQSVSAQWSGKIKAVVQGVGAFLLLYAASNLPFAGRGIIVAVSWVVLLVTLGSVVEYLAKAISATRGPAPGNGP